MDRLKATYSVPYTSADKAPASGTPQYATDGNAATNVPGTIWPSYAYNMVQDELMAFLAAAGITPDDTNWGQVLAAAQILFRPSAVSWVAGSPPSGVDYDLPVGGTAVISFTGAATIPLSIKTVEGIYEARAFVYESNTTNADISLQPNNTTFAGAFDCFSTANADQNVTGFGTATSGATLTNITATPYIGTLPIAEKNSAKNEFFFDLFNGPSASDTLNDIGPWSLDLGACTFTAGKFMKGAGAITGGGSTHFGKWNDTTTVWSSLGTIVDPNATAMSGVVTVKRLA